MKHRWYGIPLSRDRVERETRNRGPRITTQHRSRNSQNQILVDFQSKQPSRTNNTHDRNHTFSNQKNNTTKHYPFRPKLLTFTLPWFERETGWEKPHSRQVLLAFMVVLFSWRIYGPFKGDTDDMMKRKQPSKKGRSKPKFYFKSKCI